MKKTPSTILGLIVFCIFSALLYWLISFIWKQFTGLNPQVSVAILTASTTVIVATLTVVLGKYFERKKDIEAHYRNKKAEIYEEFLKEIFNRFHSVSSDQSADLASFFREWQRKVIIWGGQDVVYNYVRWMNKLKNGHPDASTIFTTEELILGIRKDLGHNNNKLKKGTFVHMLLRHSDLFLAEAEKNPAITLDELATLEKTQGLEQDS